MVCLVIGLVIGPVLSQHAWGALQGAPAGALGALQGCFPQKSTRAASPALIAKERQGFYNGKLRVWESPRNKFYEISFYLCCAERGTLF